MSAPKKPLADMQTAVILIRTTQSTKDAVQAVADKRGISLSELTRQQFAKVLREKG